MADRATKSVLKQQEGMRSVATVHLLNILRHLLLRSPDRDLLVAAAVTLKRIADEALVDTVNEAQALLDEIETLVGSGKEAMLEVQADFARLFFGPGAPAVPPCASLYLDQSWMLMQEGAAAARRAYRDLGFLLEDRSLQPDHAGVEIEFLMTMLIKSTEKDALTSDDAARARTFIEAHAMQWLPEFLCRLAQQANTALYRRTAELGAVALSQTSSLLASSREGPHEGAPVVKGPGAPQRGHRETQEGGRQMLKKALAAAAFVLSICVMSGATYAQQEQSKAVPGQEQSKAVPGQEQPKDVPGQEQPKDIPELRWKGVSFQPGFRVQVRYAYDEQTDINDIMIRRVRLKAKGDGFGIAKYYVETKTDNVAQEGKTPTTKVEAAYLDFSLRHGDLGVRIGQYDVPFSRSSLTSDSKLLFMDRARIIDELATLGLVDNTQGVLFFGRPGKGRFEYSVGLFDNEVFEKSATATSRWSGQLMPAGRVVLNLFDAPKPGGYADYQASYIGQGQRLSLGANAASLDDIHDGSSEYDLLAWGVDVFGNYEALTMEVEYDVFEKTGGGVHAEGNGWHVQSGFVLPIEAGAFKFEPVLRYQEFDPKKNVSGDKLKWTSAGVNVYLKGHSVKVQLDYTIKDEETNKVDNDILQAQLQLDF